MKRISFEENDWIAWFTGGTHLMTSTNTETRVTQKGRFKLSRLFRCYNNTFCDRKFAAHIVQWNFCGCA